MKKSFITSTLVPAALLLAASAGCSHRGDGAAELAPRPVVGINAEDIDRQPALSIEELLIARIPGLYMTRARDGHMVLHLRGVNSVSDEQEPLFVVNGIALGSARNLWAINRFDIASVEVLKDPTSTAVWGMRGSGGVIVIKTKGS
jgi:TonB-dependent SusC/RagA subfamily outer membrane receptor